MSVYPGNLDTFTTKVAKVDLYRADHMNDVQHAIVAVETELGTDPAGTLADLKTRLAVALNDDGTSKLAPIWSFTAEVIFEEAKTSGYKDITISAAPANALCLFHYEVMETGGAGYINCYVRRKGDTHPADYINVQASQVNNRQFWCKLDADKKFEINVSGTGSDPIVSGSLLAWLPTE